MAKKTTEQAYKVLNEIETEVNDGVIKDREIASLCSLETCKVTGYAVILTLSTKFDYRNTLLDNWKKRLRADDYKISVRRNQMRVRFNVRY